MPTKITAKINCHTCPLRGTEGGWNLSQHCPLTGYSSLTCSLPFIKLRDLQSEYIKVSGGS